MFKGRLKGRSKGGLREAHKKLQERSLRDVFGSLRRDLREEA